MHALRSGRLRGGALWKGARGPQPAAEGSGALHTRQRGRQPHYPPRLRREGARHPLVSASHAPASHALTFTCLTHKDMVCRCHTVASSLLSM